MVIYPPYTIEYMYGGDEFERFIGYGWLFSPPSSKELYEVISPRPGSGGRDNYEWHYNEIYINCFQLGIQIFLVMIIVSGIFLVTIKKQQE